jgi:lipopolysaccharide export system permease protein
MFTQIDRLMIRGYFKAYFICLISLLSLYVVVDLFTNLDEFTHRTHGFFRVMQHIGIYYSIKITHIFDRLSEVIVLLAGMFTIAWMQHCNELLPLLSAGVSTRRVVLPLLLSACFMLGVAVLNQELLIPQFSAELLADKDDPHGDKDVPVQGAYEPNGIHIEGKTGNRQSLVIKEFYCYIPEGLARNPLHLTAQEAQYIPPQEGKPARTGGWLLTGTQPATLDRSWERTDVLEGIDPGKYFLYTSEVDFDLVTRNSKWFTVASTLRLYDELQKPDSTRLAMIAVQFHMRLTRPLLGLILVVLGLSVILRDQNRNVFLSAGMCLVLCGVFFAAFFTCKSLGDSNFLSPALAAWLPVLLFGPLSLVMFDAVHT